MSRKIGNSLKDSALFLKHAIQHPLQVGYLLPSSPWLIHEIAATAELSGQKRIIELGPGTGGTTKGLLAAMDDDAKLISVEINPKFIAHLKKTIDDKRLTIDASGAQNLGAIIAKRNWSNVDVIVSGIPFTTLPKGMDQEIMSAIFTTLKPGGVFLAYQLRDHVSGLAEHLFGQPNKKKITYKNFPPMKIYTWRKASQAQ
ncbi:MAG: methyltransferase domain-containing protein [Proteobacteria bacterium]|nr:MAG: methyltransferase domain-containing protein [Pseudomonadota bacterium]